MTKKPAAKQKETNIGGQKAGGKANDLAIKKFGEIMKTCKDTAHKVMAAKKPIELAGEQEDAFNRQEWISANAYFRWIDESYLHGHALRHWCEAERAYDDLFRVSPPKLLGRVWKSGFVRLGFSEIDFWTLPINLASQPVMEKSGISIRTEVRVCRTRPSASSVDDGGVESP